jgi:hypothetical protein
LFVLVAESVLPGAIQRFAAITALMERLAKCVPAADVYRFSLKNI